MGKHAYLIMAHDEFDVLKEILSDLDDERNDIFLHIDKKVQSCPFEMLESCVKKSNFYLVKRMNVNWGGYSQIACELHLIEQATKIKKYDYYHLITGVTYPIKTQDTIHEFFDKNQGIEFVGYDNKKDYGDRVRYIHIFNELGKPDTKLKQIKSGFQNKIVIMQKRINFCKSSVRNIEFKKGLVYWSLTDNAIRFILSQKKIIKNIF